MERNILDWEAACRVGVWKVFGEIGTVIEKGLGKAEKAVSQKQKSIGRMRQCMYLMCN